MTAEAIVVLIPVLRRPWRARPVAEAFRAATTEPYRLLFICSPGDDAEINAVQQAGEPFIVAPFTREPGDWARKINLGYRLTDEPLMLLGADDIQPRAGWAEAVRHASAMSFGVIGTQDLGNKAVIAGSHSTHPVVARWYADELGTIDCAGQVVTEVYDHNYVDNELVETAQSRGAWAFASDAVVEHLHPSWRKAPVDPVYELGIAQWNLDRATFFERRPLWMRP